ncbi:hypothetical protein HKCCE4037_02560 [Rhodobacterales bacterium HKCCE4037]|nr:hypothetical protein [Rhodobacterales bacterium HKCCE4037]
MAILCAAAVQAQDMADRMLCEWIPPCVVQGTCEDTGPNPQSSLERDGETWLWDPAAAWDGFPVALAATLPEAEAIATSDGFSLGLILVPDGLTEDGALILLGYHVNRALTVALSDRTLVHHCVDAAEVGS